MALITRRHFARQMAFAAALCGRPLWAIGESPWLFDADKQNGAPPDPQTIRKLASQIVGQVITPEAADYDAARSIFNRAFDRRPAVIVRCGIPSDVARALEFCPGPPFAPGRACRRPQPARVRDVRWRRRNRPLRDETSRSRHQANEWPAHEAGALRA